MISVAAAKQFIKEQCNVLSPVPVPVAEAGGLVLASSVVAPYDMPAFYQSSMDGYAFRFADWQAGSELTVVAESAAGNTRRFTLGEGEACRIFTGAPLPDGADTVVMQEKVQRIQSQIIIEETIVAPYQHVRRPGAEIKQGTVALEAGNLLNPAAISFLAGIGINSVSVYPSPAVTIIVTGNEFQPATKTPAWGKVYESNTAGLSTALSQAGITDIRTRLVPDDLDATADALQAALNESDMILLTGGVSVGEYDFVVTAARQCGVTQHFHRVKQKPGKPLFFGTCNKVVVFGLPGNPSSVLTCFYEYVVEAISCLTKRNVNLTRRSVRLNGNYTKAAGLTHFLKARFDGEKVNVLSAQESFRLATFATANCLLIAEEEHTTLNENDFVTIHLLP